MAVLPPGHAMRPFETKSESSIIYDSKTDFDITVTP